jgi:hypothetical protein
MATKTKKKKKVKAKADYHRMEVTFDNRNPVALSDLTLSLLAVSQQYERFVEDELSPENRASSTLLVKDVRSGSYVFELIAHGVQIAPLLWTGGSLSEWCRVAKDVILYLNGKLSVPPKEITKTDLKQWNNILEPVAKDHGSQMNFVVSEGATFQQIIINSVEANSAQNRIRRELAALEEPVDVTHKKRVMTWYQAKFDPDSQTGNKAKIESISRKPLRVVFDNNAIREAMFAQGSEFGKPWQKLAYLVDVQVQNIEEKPTVATILRFYPDETFDPADR